MKNLSLLLESVSKNQRQLKGLVKQFCVRTPLQEPKQILFVTSESVLYRFSPATQLLEELGPVGEELESSEEEQKQKGEVIGLEYIAEEDKACICNSNGEIYMVEVTGSTAESECVGIIQDGITAMKWSPDYEIVVFISRAGSLLLMTKNWDLLSETPLLSNSSATPQLEAAISWRGDGSYFVCNIKDEKGRPLLRVFERTSIPNATSEFVESLCPARVSWRYFPLYT